MTSELQQVLEKILKSEIIDFVHFPNKGMPRRQYIEEICPDGMLISNEHFISGDKITGVMTISEDCIKVCGENGDYWFYPAFSKNIIKLITE